MRSNNFLLTTIGEQEMSFWDEIEEKDYLPFAKFTKGDKYDEIIIQLADKEPSLFKNRWGKEQYSIRCWVYKLGAKNQLKLVETDGEQDMFLLAGGTRLFRTIKPAKDFEGALFLRRLGEGFKTHYKLIKKYKI